MHIHWHRPIRNPLEQLEPSDYTPIQRPVYREIPKQCRCGHRKVQVVNPFQGIAFGGDMEVRHWLRTGKWVPRDTLIARIKFPPPMPMPGSRAKT